MPISLISAVVVALTVAGVSLGFIVTDPAFLVAVTFFIFCAFALNKISPLATAFFSEHEGSLKGRLLTTLELFKKEMAHCKEQEEVLQLSSLVLSNSLNFSNSAAVKELNPYISGVYNQSIKEDIFLSTSYKDFYKMLEKLWSENERRVDKIRHYL